MPSCPNCHQEVSGNYCANCGQSQKLKRIDGHYIIHEIEHVLHFEKGILYTMRELLLRPGQSIRRFLTDDRSRLVKPVIFIIISSLLYTIINHFFHLDDGYVKVDIKAKSSITVIMDWVRAHYGYANIMMGIFIALWIKVFFRKQQYNVFEIVILLCFVMGMAMLFLALFSLIEGLTGFPLLRNGSMLAVIYCAWAIGNFFNPQKVRSYIAALFSYLFGMASFMIGAVGLGYLIDVIFKPFG